MPIPMRARPVPKYSHLMTGIPFMDAAIPRSSCHDRVQPVKPRIIVSELWGRNPFGESREWNAGRRAASREGGRAAPLGAEDKNQRLPAFRFLFLFPGSERKKPKSPRSTLKVEEPRFENPQRRQKARSGSDDSFFTSHHQTRESPSGNIWPKS